ncbi:MAG: Uncharacterized protein FD149_212 [Rhodospirillaceae bacterium]|nr:MAG: Uncharacterized protein FD149_212 [Rhodospirillaceae bacterium]
MQRLSRILVVLILAILLGAIGFLATWDIPPPTARVEKAIPYERFTSK